MTDTKPIYSGITFLERKCYYCYDNTTKIKLDNRLRRKILALPKLPAFSLWYLLPFDHSLLFIKPGIS